MNSESMFGIYVLIVIQQLNQLDLLDALFSNYN